MTEELEAAVCEAMADLAQPITQAHIAEYFRLGFLCGYEHRMNLEIAQLDEKLERLK